MALYVPCVECGATASMMVYLVQNIIGSLIVKADNHKPEDTKEKERIERLGGSVMLSHKGDMRVVWVQKHPVATKKTSSDQESYKLVRIPFLNVARSLGDLWSMIPEKKYLVSPEPDVCAHKLDLKNDKFIIIATDGLWDMLTPQETIMEVFKHSVRNDDEASKIPHVLIDNALERWKKKKQMADNISVLIVFFNSTAEQPKLGKRANRTDSLCSESKKQSINKPPQIPNTAACIT